MKPILEKITLPGGLLNPHQTHLKRVLSAMRGQYHDEQAYQTLLAGADILVYEVYEVLTPDTPGDLRHGTSIVHPGKVGDEYFMTKGHYHALLETAEVYYCLQGHGYMMMETPEGDWSAEELVPGMALYVPPCWAHRSINVGAQDFITFFTYPANSGHDYGAIETRGFRKLIVVRDGKPLIVDNPNWKKDGG